MLKNENYNNINLVGKIELKEGVTASMKIVVIGKLKLYFSYNTIIAFKEKGKLFISKNVWSKTTGKHLNYINNDKKKRLKNSTFENELKRVLKKYNLV